MTEQSPEHVVIHPEPTAAETAAILAAFAELWPVSSDSPTQPRSTRWRFSGRWWANDPGQRVPGRAWR